MSDPCQILFCDYDGEFEFSDTLSRMGFSVDQIRPDALRQVSVGDHQIYIFSFSLDASMKKAFRTCEKLKMADLKTPILFVNFSPATPEFLNHKSSKNAADGYLSHVTESRLLDAIEAFVPCPVPPALKGGLLLSEAKEYHEKAEIYKRKVEELEGKVKELETRSKSAPTESLDKALEVQRNYFKPKLQALLKGQKKQLQTETEKLKFELSEMEAKLLDREQKIKEFEGFKEKAKYKLEEITQSHEKAQQTLREFYQNKIRTLEGDKKSETSDSNKGSRKRS